MNAMGVGIVKFCLKSLIVSAGFWVTAAAADVPSCVYETLPGDGQVCLYRGEGHIKKYVLYYFHGVSGSEKDWELKDLPLAIQDGWKSKGLGTPSVIAISYGMYWLATPSGNFGYKGKLDFLNSENLNSLEGRLGLTNIQGRWIYGDSMGGHTVWELAFRNPRFFDKVASTCSAQMSVTPFQYPNQFKSYATLSGGWVSWILGASVMFRSFYETEEVWNQESPLGLLRNFQPQAWVQYLVMTVSNDVYGFTLPNREIFRTLQNRGANIRYFESEGKHCLPVTAPLIDFLSSE